MLESTISKDKTKIFNKLLSLLAIILMIGCHHVMIQSGKFSVAKRHWDLALEQIEGVVIVDLGICATRKIELVHIVREYPMVVVVTGCNQQAI
jgi:hypothetical protein